MVHDGNLPFSEPVTKLLYAYSCTACDLEDDQVKGSVEAALHTINLKQYQGETNTGKQPVKTNKVCYVWNAPYNCYCILLSKACKLDYVNKQNNFSRILKLLYRILR